MKIFKGVQKFSRLAAALALAMLAAGTYSASAATTQDQTTDQQRLNNKVRHALVMLPWYGVFDNLRILDQRHRSGAFRRGSTTGHEIRCGGRREACGRRDARGGQHYRAAAFALR